MNPNSPDTGHLLSHLQDAPGMVKAIGAGLPRRGDRDQMGGVRLQQQVLPGQMLNSFCQVTGLTAEDHPRDSHLGPREGVLPQPPALLGACEGVEMYGGDAGHLGLHQHPVTTPVGHQRVVVNPSPTVDYQRQSSAVREGTASSPTACRTHCVQSRGGLTCPWWTRSIPTSPRATHWG